jgi:hypothetical protein
MAVTGPIFEGGPDVTLYGTAKEVVAQILALNPNAFDNVTIADDDVAGTTPATKRGLLDRRAWPIVSYILSSIDQRGSCLRRES